MRVDREDVRARRRCEAIEVGEAGQRQTRRRRPGALPGVDVGVERSLAGEGDTVTRGGRVADRAAVGDLLAELVVDAAAILEVEDAVAAAQDGLAGAEGVVREADARGVVVEVVLDDGAGEAVLVGEIDVAGVRDRARTGGRALRWGR